MVQNSKPIDLDEILYDEDSHINTIVNEIYPSNDDLSKSYNIYNIILVVGIIIIIILIVYYIFIRNKY